MLLLLFAAHAASWEDDLAAELAAAATTEARLTALRAALGDPAHAEHIARIRAVAQVLPTLEGRSSDVARDVLAHALRGEPFEVPALPLEPWAALLIESLVQSADAESAFAALQAARSLAAVDRADRLALAEAVLEALPSDFGTYAARVGPVFAFALSSDPAERRRALGVAEGTFDGLLELVRAGIVPVDRARRDRALGVVTGWWWTCEADEGPAPWVWSEDSPHRRDCEDRVLNEKKGWTVTMGGEPMVSMAELEAQSAYRRMPGCGPFVDIELRYEEKAYVSYNGVGGTNRTIIRGKALTRPSDCRTEAEGRQDVAAANTMLEERLAEASGG